MVHETVAKVLCVDPKKTRSIQGVEEPASTTASTESTTDGRDFCIEECVLGSVVNAVIPFRHEL
jgi:hypothetical protein